MSCGREPSPGVAVSLNHRRNHSKEDSVIASSVGVSLSIRADSICDESNAPGMDCTVKSSAISKQEASRWFRKRLVKSKYGRDEDKVTDRKQGSTLDGYERPGAARRMAGYFSDISPVVSVSFQGHLSICQTESDLAAMQYRKYSLHTHHKVTSSCTL